MSSGHYIDYTTLVPNFSEVPKPCGSVLDDAFAPLRMPEHTAGISQKGHAESPGLHCRWARRLYGKLIWQIQCLDVGPPRVEVVHHQLHHEIPRPVLLVMALQDESAGARTEDGHFAVEKLFESERLVKALGQVEILCRQEGAGQLCSRRDGAHLGFS